MSAPLEWDALWAALDADPDEWTPTTGAMFYDQLGVVPPQRRAKGAFLGGEPLRVNRDGDYVYHCFKVEGGGFFACNMTECGFILEFA